MHRLMLLLSVAVPVVHGFVGLFIVAFTDVGVSVQKDTSFLFGLIKGAKWETITGYVILPEVRQTALAIVGFYFGSSQVK
jgi:hypothetical protein